MTKIVCVRVGNVLPPTNKQIKQTIAALVKLEFLKKTPRNVYCLNTRTGLLVGKNQKKAEFALKAGLTQGLFSALSALVTKSSGGSVELEPQAIALSSYITKFKSHHVSRRTFTMYG